MRGSKAPEACALEGGPSLPGAPARKEKVTLVLPIGDAPSEIMESGAAPLFGLRVAEDWLLLLEHESGQNILSVWREPAPASVTFHIYSYTGEGTAVADCDGNDAYEFARLEQGDRFTKACDLYDSDDGAVFAVEFNEEEEAMFLAADSERFEKSIWEAEDQGKCVAAISPKLGKGDDTVGLVVAPGADLALTATIACVWQYFMPAGVDE